MRASLPGQSKNQTRPRPAGDPVGGAEPQERLLTAKEISPRLFIQPRTVALWARQGRLPAYRIGRKLGFKWEEVERALPKTNAESGKFPAAPGRPGGPSLPQSQNLKDRAARATDFQPRNTQN